MCKNLFGGGGDQKVVKDMAEPEKTAEPDEVGAARKAEDEELFGGVPELRVDRSATSGGVAASGTGLKVM
jgi:hypothetical protein